MRVSTSLTDPNPGVESFMLDNFVLPSSTFGTILPGGFGPLQLQLKPGLRNPIPKRAHIEVFGPGMGTREAVCWEGRLRQAELSGRDVKTIVGVGYGIAGGAVEDDFLDSANITSPQIDASQCLLTALSASSKLLVQGAKWDSSGVEHALSLFDGRTALQVAQQVTTEAPYDFAVWELRRAWFWHRIAPATTSCDYEVSEIECPQWQPDESQIWTAVRVTFTNSDTRAADFVDYEDTSASSLWGGRRRTLIPGGTTDRAGATSHAVRYVTDHKYPLVRAQIGPQAALKTPTGTRVPACDVRAGQWVHVATGTQDDQRSPAIIVQTTCDFNGMITAQLGQPAFDATGRMVAATQSITRIASNTNLVTGARAS